MKICSVEDIKKLDRIAIEEYGISSSILMENAGNAVVSLILEKDFHRKRNVVVISGTGNNGGDGFVVARKLYSYGYNVKVFVIGDVNRIKGSALENYKILEKIGIPLYNVNGFKNLEPLKEAIYSSDIIIDAIFGTGLSRDIKGIYRNVIDFINNSGKIVVSIDIPSGINGNNGKVMGVAVKADYTVTFGLPKLGNILYPGYQYCGSLYVSHISYPPQLYDFKEINVETNDPVPIPPRDPAGHKGTFGKALVISGAFGYFGAPYFSSMAFLKSGGGYVRLIAPKSIVPFISSVGNEIVFIPVAETEEGSVSFEERNKILKFVEMSDIVIIGPGLSLNTDTQKLILWLIKEIDKPLIIDGDGLTAVSRDVNIVRNRRQETVLTPHLGEMSRITKLNIQDIEEDKIGVLRKTVHEMKHVIVLKGAHTLIGYPNGKVFINMSGNSGMATPGSGDILTGIIAAMYTLGLSFEDAVRMGVFLHGFAGDLAAENKGEDGLTARDILEYVPYAIKMIRENFKRVQERYKIPLI
ncbi:MAG: NAD(P)H-hydrate dehydratase [Thermoproteales archaeon]|nr:NAD(P)H-hydrate dehydratase [Thermoproteales archaeon]